MKLFFTFIISCVLFVAEAQLRKNAYDLYFGGQFGGPIPSQTNDSASGKPLLSPKIGGRLSFQISKKSKLAIGFSLSQKGASYQQVVKHDTLVDVGYGLVPTFYIAKVVGEMKLLYLDIPFDISYSVSQKQTIAVGIASSFLVSGFDRGTVSVNVGYGGFADFNEDFNNYSTINAFDFGVHFFYKFQFYKRVFASIDAYRSLRGLYKSNDSNLYHTHAALVIGYSF